MFQTSKEQVPSFAEVIFFNCMKMAVILKVGLVPATGAWSNFCPSILFTKGWKAHHSSNGSRVKVNLGSD